jgi:hypothetical protein
LGWFAPERNFFLKRDNPGAEDYINRRLSRPKRIRKGLFGNDLQQGFADPHPGLAKPIIFSHISPEIGGIIGIDGNPKAGVQKPGQGVILQSFASSQLPIGYWTNGKRNLFLYQTANQFRILQAPYSMVDPLGPQKIQSLANVIRRPLLSRMSHNMKSGVPNPLEYAGEL